MKRHPLLHLVELLAFPLIAAGLFVLLVTIQTPFRYNDEYFTEHFRSIYSSPGTVADALERAIRTDDQGLYAELTGMRRVPAKLEHNPSMRLLILFEVSNADYFQYLFMNTQTYERASFYLKEVNGRWVVVPQDAYYYLDSGQWIVVITPLAVIWWAVVIVVTLAVVIYRAAARIRQDMYGMRGP